jgi:molybdopterin synthase catalytic subunit
MGTVRVRLFARLAELAGTRETEIEVGEGLRAVEVYSLLGSRHPAISPFADRVMFAVNQEYTTRDHPLLPGDELALIPPVSGGAELLEVTADPLDPDRLYDHVRKDAAGAVVLFYGVVRDHNQGRAVDYLEYDAYPEMAVREMRRLAGEVRGNWQVTEVAIQHRTGRLEVGEASLLVAVSSPHRREAFEAGQWLVDRFKDVVPIWKKEVFEGGEEWIEGETAPAQ